MAEFPAILAAPFFGKYFNLAGYVATEDSLFVPLFPRILPVSIFVLQVIEQWRIHYGEVSCYSCRHFFQ
jgi:hypothetical protein